jgi:hypothetical protein
MLVRVETGRNRGRRGAEEERNSLQEPLPVVCGGRRRGASAAVVRRKPAEGSGAAVVWWREAVGSDAAVVGRKLAEEAARRWSRGDRRSERGSGDLV